MYNEDHILKAWQQNAAPWIATIDNEEIPSRPQITNLAIVEAVLATRPGRVLDVGCGEGWLSRTLSTHGLLVVGVDGAKGLIRHAMALGHERYFEYSYEALIAGKNEDLGMFNTIVFNFSLFGETTTRDLLHCLRKNLTPGGHMVIQTLHPQHELGQARDATGWVTEDWQGMARPFEQAYRWYFRDEAGWEKLFAETGYRLLAQQQVPNPATGRALSAIFILQKN